MQLTSSAVVVREPGAGPATWFLDNLLVTKVTAADGAAYSLCEASLPAGSHTPFHRHRDEDEAFYILEGRMTVFIDGGRVLRARPGMFVHIPRGTAHGFRTDTALRMLVVTGVEGFLDMAREAGMPAPRAELPPAGPPDFPRLEAAAAKYNIELLGPLPA